MTALNTNKNLIQTQYECGHLYELLTPELALLVFCKVADPTHSKFLISYHQNNENRIEIVEKFVKHLPSIPLVNTKTTHETILLQNKAEYFQLKDCKGFLSYKISWLEELQILHWHKKEKLPITEKNLNLFFNKLRKLTDSLT